MKDYTYYHCDKSERLYRTADPTPVAFASTASVYTPEGWKAIDIYSSNWWSPLIGADQVTYVEALKIMRR